MSLQKACTVFSSQVPRQRILNFNSLQEHVIVDSIVPHIELNITDIYILNAFIKSLNKHSNPICLNGLLSHVYGRGVCYIVIPYV